MVEHSTDEKTIKDFGEQWTYLTDNAGYYGSVALLSDIIEPLLSKSDVAGKRILEVGS